MPRQNPIDENLDNLVNTAPPPPYPGTDGGRYDLTPMPQSQNRPRLPEHCRNPRLRSLPEDTFIIKFQTIVREGKEIIIGRVKVPTPGPSQHAFILRRYDTNAISLTTMYKVSFPGASEEDEKREMDWVRSSYDTRNTNGGRDCDAVRLAGQWVSRHLAIHLAPAYGLLELILALGRAEPDPNVSYRKSQRSQAAADEMNRQRDAARQQQQQQQQGAAEPSRPVPAIAAPDAASPAPKRVRRVEASTPTAEEGTPSRRVTVEATTTLTGPAGAAIDMNAEIESAKQLVRDLKHQLQRRAAAGDELEETGFAESEASGSRGVKRSATEEGTSISSGAARGTERVIRTNKRVQEGNNVGQTVKKAAFGAMLFGLGATAAMWFPQIAELASNYM